MYTRRQFPRFGGGRCMRIIHNWDDIAAVAIPRVCLGAMSKTGRLLLVERVVGPPNEPDVAKLSDLNLLVLVGGRERTVDEVGALLAGAGLLTEVIPAGSHSRLVEAMPV